MQNRRPFDEVKTILAITLGVPALAGSVYLLLFFVGVVWKSSGVLAAAVAFVVGVAGLTAATYKSYELIQEAGGR